MVAALFTGSSCCWSLVGMSNDKNDDNNDNNSDDDDDDDDDDDTVLCLMHGAFKGVHLF